VRIHGFFCDYGNPLNLGEHTVFRPPNDHASVNSQRRLRRPEEIRMNESVVPAMQVTFRHTDHSEALEARIRELAGKLVRFHDRITSCRVVVDGPSSNREFTVSLDVLFPGGAIHANSGRASRSEHSDPYIAVRDAFENARRQLGS
jgi:ribosome-associated translation inhibitor RaiA